MFCFASVVFFFCLSQHAECFLCVFFFFYLDIFAGIQFARLLMLGLATFGLAAFSETVLDEEDMRFWREESRGKDNIVFKEHIITSFIF